MKNLALAHAVATYGSLNFFKESLILSRFLASIGQGTLTALESICPADLRHCPTNHYLFLIITARSTAVNGA